MLNVFLYVILPTFLVAAAGGVLQRWRGLSPLPLNQLMLYLLGPSLILNSLLTTKLQASEAERIIAAVILVTLVLLATGAILGRALGQERPMRSGFLLATVFPNAANMALPVALLAFGNAGLAVAVVIFAAQSVLSWSLGVFVAASSAGGGLEPLKQTLRLPMLWAIGLAIVLRAAGVTLPFTLQHPIEMLGNASIPVMLVILGFQLSRGIQLEQWPSLVAALTMRLIGGAAIAFGVTSLLGLTGVTQETVIVVAGMPTAVFTTILATEFKAEPRFVTSAVIASTLLSLVTLTLLITLVQNWLA